MPKAQNTAERGIHSETSVLFSVPFSLSKVGKILPILGSPKRQISKTGKLNRKRRSKKGERAGQALYYGILSQSALINLIALRISQCLD